MPARRSKPLGHTSHTRGYLPHIEGAAYQAVTYRLADSLPIDAVRRLREMRATEGERRVELERWLGAGYGSCLLKEPRNARCVVENWRHFDGIDYDLIAYVVMPNHVHVLVRVFAGCSLSKLVHSWKSYTAKRILRGSEGADDVRANGYSAALGMPARVSVAGAGGPPALHRNAVWEREYRDRYIRDDAHLQRCIDYIHENPVKAGLVARACDWEWSSACRSGGGPPAPGA